MGTLDEATGVMQNAIKVKVCGASDMGRIRKNNEDNFVVCNLTTGEVSRTPPPSRPYAGEFWLTVYGS